MIPKTKHKKGSAIVFSSIENRKSLFTSKIIDLKKKNLNSYDIYKLRNKINVFLQMITKFHNVDLIMKSEDFTHYFKLTH